ncbi:STY4528 family pathogenicity island replication protein [Pseudomonas sp. P105]|uniref:STY4528 family pathogenicity island replication protein n=1 Tax=Pseudomonas sp. P105 TaxID=3049542 RepID=UPI0029352876|nr:STY4528 family pathogenicity island replication protein [Pseudomonas sp. P105]WNZ76381.1 STY4528 family pathogenicity island replication protein [Pseudomonas sp. P105]
MSRTAPASLSSLLDDALERLQPQGKQPSGDGFLFSGNRHQTVPRALLLDPRLTPLERNAWQVFLLLLNDDGVSAFPTYDQLRRYLTSVPCGKVASHETVAKALTMLRLTRWLSLVRRRRDKSTGRVLGNLYVLHDTPLSPFEAMQLDPTYMGLVSTTLEHANKGIQAVALAVLEEMSQDPHVQTQLLPSRLQVLTQRLLEPQSVSDEPFVSSEELYNTTLRNQKTPASESEPGVKPNDHYGLRNPKAASILSTKALKEVRTESRSGGACELKLPTQFNSLTKAQQAGARVALLQLDCQLRQAVLDEWATRCRKTHVRNPAGYLFGIIQKAMNGHFTAWAAKLNSHEPVQPSAMPKQETKTERDPAVALACLAELKGMFRLR